jgi:Pyridoxamine 5'-phosphate oxidase
MARLTDKVRMLFDGQNFAVLSTLEPDGRPHSTVTWVKRDEDEVLFALPRSRRKARPWRATRSGQRSQIPRSWPSRELSVELSLLITCAITGHCTPMRSRQEARDTSE